MTSSLEELHVVNECDHVSSQSLDLNDLGQNMEDTWPLEFVEMQVTCTIALEE